MPQIQFRCHCHCESFEVKPYWKLSIASEPQNELSTKLPPSVVVAPYLFARPVLDIGGFCTICVCLCVLWQLCSKWIFKFNVCKCVASFALNKSKIFARDTLLTWPGKKENRRENIVRFKVHRESVSLVRSCFSTKIYSSKQLLNICVFCSVSFN